MNELMRTILWLPEQASTFARPVDELHYFVITVTMLSSIAVGLLAFGFFFKYRQRRVRQSTPIVIPSVRFELAVVVVPLVFFLAWFVQGYRDYVWYTTPPKDAMDVYVMGKKWMWKFAYPDGPNAIGTLHVPANRPVRLLLTSRDVIHSFFVPDFRIKMDVLPGRYTETWFEATKPGRYQILCTEYCGTWHSQMWGEVVVMPPAEFDELDDPAAGRAGRPRGHRRRRRPLLPRDASSSTASGWPWRRGASSVTRWTAIRTSARPGSTSTAAARRWRPARPSWPTRPT